MMGKSNWEDVRHLTEGVAVIVPALFAMETLLPGFLNYFIGVSLTPCVSLHTVRFEAGDVEAMQLWQPQGQSKLDRNRAD